MALRKLRHVVDPETGCWVWLGPTSSHGYPYGFAHRQYWELFNGPRPAGADIHHRCKNRRCVNPEHLEPIDRRAHDVLHKLQERTGLTLEDVKEIRRLGRQPGVRAVEVAARYGIGLSTVTDWWRGRCWTDLLGEDEHIRPEPWKCARTDCDNLVTGHRRHKRYCSPRCRRTQNERHLRARRKTAALATEERADG